MPIETNSLVIVGSRDRYRSMEPIEWVSQRSLRYTVSKLYTIQVRFTRNYIECNGTRVKTDV